jgi:O-antigen/teichoic acid export membrane protein
VQGRVRVDPKPPMGPESEVQTSVTAKSLVGGAAGYTAALCVAAAAGLVNMRLGLEYLGTAQYSLLLLAGTISGWGVIGNMGLGDAIRQRMTSLLAKNRVDEAARCLSGGVLSLALIGSLLFGVFLVLHFTGATRTILGGDVPDVARASRLLLLGVGLFLIRFPFNPLGAVILARNQLVAHNGFAILFAATRPIVLWLTLERTDSLETLLVVQSAHQWLDLMLRYLFVRRQVPALRVQFSLSSLGTARSLIAPSLSYLVISLGMVVIYSTDNAVIGGVVGVEYIVGYAAAFRLFSILRQICTSGIEVLFPAAAILDARGEQDRLRELVLLGGRFALSLAVLGGAGLAYLGAPLIDVWLGDKLEHLPSAATLLVLGAILPVGVLINALGRAVTGVGRHHRQAAIFLVEITLNLVLSITLARQHGVYGVALGTLISRSVVTLAHAADSVYTLGLRPSSILRRILLPAGGIAIPLVLVGQSFPVPLGLGLAPLLSIIALYAVVCGAAMWLITPHPIREKVRARLRRRPKIGLLNPDGELR